MLGKGILIDHGAVVVIGETAVVGDNCTIYQGVTLGGVGTRKGKRHPTLGKNVTVGAGAKILGSFVVGDNCKIAANAVLLKPLADNSTAAGIPARPIKVAGVAVQEEKEEINCDFSKLEHNLKALSRRVEELEDMLVSTLGGRAAEEIVFDSVTTGASNDIEKATSIARAMVTQYGMSERFGLIGLAKVENQYLSGRAVLDCGDTTATEIDNEVMRILKNSYDEAIRILSENRAVMDKLAEFLIKKETITGKEFMKILREIKGLPEKVEIKKAILV